MYVDDNYLPKYLIKFIENAIKHSNMNRNFYRRNLSIKIHVVKADVPF